MHELGVCEAIIGAVEERAGGRRISELAVTVGGAHVADEGALRASFEMAAEGTVAEGAALEVSVDPLRLRCCSCGGETTFGDGIMTPACRRCGCVDVELVGGEEVVLDRLVFEKPAFEEAALEEREHLTMTRVGPSRARPSAKKEEGS